MIIEKVGEGQKKEPYEAPKLIVALMSSDVLQATCWKASIFLGHGALQFPPDSEVNPCGCWKTLQQSGI